MVRALRLKQKHLPLILTLGIQHLLFKCAVFCYMIFDRFIASRFRRPFDRLSFIIQTSDEHWHLSSLDPHFGFKGFSFGFGQLPIGHQIFYQTGNQLLLRLHT
ncbi:hypothetical protein DB771_14345 [Burkholderia sp. AU29985]|nr:hypothetical protein XM57_08520 [Burkholderia cepacia]AYZ97736.1 hypothetical protein EGY28_22480 [Burkholderia dolosa]ETP66785.1 hypothetical protein BDSB_05140 [Burkholderia dolosa PC543]PRE44826.1 hypothetical protein C6P87_22750 [Burkholderia sp. AU12872]PUA76213.1 hypothetical protein DB771_14345 [Burkholderia sp. AU29985]